MKNIINYSISLAALVLVTFAMGCNQTPAEKETIIVNQKEPSTHVIIEKEAKPASTTITLDKNGAKLEAEKIEVKVK